MDTGANVLSKELHDILIERYLAGCDVYSQAPKTLSTERRIWFRITYEGHILKLEGITKVSRPKWPHYIYIQEVEA